MTYSDTRNACWEHQRQQAIRREAGSTLDRLYHEIDGALADLDAQQLTDLISNVSSPELKALIQTALDLRKALDDREARAKVHARVDELFAAGYNAAAILIKLA